ncbi:MAG: glutamine amidotransferase [Dehalococcoidia bacterium]|nr:glutamine amidotransferase [Dehalococcoidia bacterium]
MVTIAVLALQGDFREHVAVLHRLGAQAREVRTAADLSGVDGLIMPGGESTAICRLMDRWALRGPILDLAKSGVPVWGTCAGLILLAKRIVDDPIQSLGLLDIDVRRNAYGRQVDSFETEVPMRALGDPPMPAVFIRAPVITRVGPDVEVLGSLPDGTPVAVREGNLLGSSFHPELTPDSRFHEYLITLAKEHVGLSNATAI